MKRDPFVIIGTAVAVFLTVMLALAQPADALIPVAVMAGVLWFLLDKSHRTRKSLPCQVCGQRFRGADMVEHHVNEHRECAS